MERRPKRAHRSAGAALLAAAALACAPADPNTDPLADGGPLDAGAGLDAGGRSDAGGVSDAGTGFRDAGENPDAGASPLADGGSAPDAGAPACGLPELCPATDLEAVAVTLRTGSDSALLADGAALVLGVATRAEVEAALGGPGITVGDNAFRATYCSHRLALHYVDDVNPSGIFEGGASAGDVLVRVVTLSGARASASNGAELGGARAGEAARLASPSAYATATGGYDVSPSDGLALVSDAGGAVISMTLFSPQPIDGWALPIDVAAGRVGVSGAQVGKGRTFAHASGVLGSSFEREGIQSLTSLLDVQVRSYAAFGIRLAGVCSRVFPNQPCDETNESDSVVLSPPFLGQSAEGLRLGLSEAEVETLLGSPGRASADNPDLKVYDDTGGEALGVVYVDDAACVPRAAALVLAYRETPN